MQEVIDLYVKAVDLAKQEPSLSNQKIMILNRLKICLLNGVQGEADKEMACFGKIKRSTIHKIRELAESCFEDLLRNAAMDDMARDQMLEEGKTRADMAEVTLLQGLIQFGLVIED